MNSNKKIQLLDYSKISSDLLKENNKIRTDPKSYIPKLQNWLSKFRDKTLYLLNENPLKTFEGKEAVQEAIEFLSRQRPLPELTYSKELSLAAQDHVNDIGSKGLTSHEGSDNSNLSDRIERYTEWDNQIAESLDFGFIQAENIICNLLIDDGVKERYQRMNLFNSTYKFIGIAIGPHRDFNSCSVFVYATKLRDLGVPPHDGINYIQDYIQKTFYKKRIVNSFQEEDPDAPDDTISVKIEKCHKNINGKDKRITKKIYMLKDKTQHIMEREEN